MKDWQSEINRLEKWIGFLLIWVFVLSYCLTSPSFQGAIR